MGSGSCFKDKQSRDFGLATLCSLSAGIGSAAGGCGNSDGRGFPCWMFSRALQQAVVQLVPPCLAAVASPSFPPLRPSGREQKQDCQREKQK